MINQFVSNNINYFNLFCISIWVSYIDQFQFPFPVCLKMTNNGTIRKDEDDQAT
jgi:hypothetical protein